MLNQAKTAEPRGATAVEFALLLPLLLLLVLGTIDWGYYFYLREVVVNASREGARTGTLYVAGGLTEAEAAARDYLTRGALRGAATVTSGTGAVDSVWVQVSYPAGSITGFLTPVMPANIVARAEMRR